MSFTAAFPTVGKIGLNDYQDKKIYEMVFRDVSITHPSNMPTDRDCGVEMGRRAVIYYLRKRKKRT